MKIIPFSPPDVGNYEINEISKVLKSGWITTGPKTKELEKIIANFCNVSNCVCLNSQTAAAEMTLRLLGIGKGDEVIVPAYTYTASCSVILHVGAKPILIDSQKDSIEMDYDKLERAINNKTKIIIPVDVAGCMCDYKRIFDIVNRKKKFFKSNNKIQKAFGRIIVVSDSAHALGAQYYEKKAGGVADFSCFSFHAVKNMTTAEGGAVTWKNIKGIKSDDLYHQYQLLSLHGQSKDALSKTKLGSWEYDIVGPWYKCNMTDIVAAIGIAQMKRYDAMLNRRREIIKKYDDAFKKFNVSVLPHLRKNKLSSGHLYILRLNNFSIYDRNKFIELMAKEGVICNVHYKPLPMFTAYKKLGFDIKNFPNAYNLYKNEITIPLHTCLTDKDVSKIINVFGKVYLSF